MNEQAMTTPPQVSDESVSDEQLDALDEMSPVVAVKGAMLRMLTAEIRRLRSHPRAGLTGEQIVACDAGIEALTWYSDATNEPDIRDYRLRLAATLRARAK
jgi:hypothetical protein